MGIKSLAILGEHARKVMQVDHDVLFFTIQHIHTGCAQDHESKTMSRRADVISTGVYRSDPNYRHELSDTTFDASLGRGYLVSIR